MRLFGFIRRTAEQQNNEPQNHEVQPDRRFLNFEILNSWFDILRFCPKQT